MSLQRDSYRNPNGVRADSARTPGRGMGKGLGRGSKDATSADFDAYHAEHFPEESRYTVIRYAWHLWRERGRGKTLPPPADVWERMRAAGETNAQIRGES